MTGRKYTQVLLSPAIKITDVFHLFILLFKALHIFDSIFIFNKLTKMSVYVIDVLCIFTLFPVGLKVLLPSACISQGILDIVVLSKGHTKNDLAIHALKNNFEADAYFVKVIGEYLIYMFYY